jgi:hypothetical protein
MSKRVLARDINTRETAHSPDVAVSEVLVDDWTTSLVPALRPLRQLTRDARRVAPQHLRGRRGLRLSEARLHIFVTWRGPIAEKCVRLLTHLGCRQLGQRPNLLIPPGSRSTNQGTQGPIGTHSTHA